MRALRTSIANSRGFGGVLGEVFRRSVGGLFEAGGIFAGHHRRFDEEQFLQLDAFAERLGVVDDRDRIFFVDKPKARKGVAVDEDDKGVEAGLFEAGRVKEGEVKASADTV